MTVLGTVVADSFFYIQFRVSRDCPWGMDHVNRILAALS